MNEFVSKTNDFDLTYIPRDRKGGKKLGQIICDSIKRQRKMKKNINSLFKLHSVIDWRKADGSEEAFVSPGSLSVSKSKLTCGRKLQSVNPNVTEVD